MRALFVTSNPDKRREAAGILGLELEAADPGDLPEIQALSVPEVAARKALDAYRALGEPDSPILVEDSGLVVEAWNGLPGAFTRWFMSSVGNGGLLAMLGPAEDRAARAVCAVAVAFPGGSVEVFSGEVRGELSPEPRGSGGFGWDPIFVPEGEHRTYAEMGPAKHADSHRTRAFIAVRERLLEPPGSS